MDERFQVVVQTTYELVCALFRVSVPTDLLYKVIAFRTR